MAKRDPAWLDEETQLDLPTLGDLASKTEPEASPPRWPSWSVWEAEIRGSPSPANPAERADRAGEGGAFLRWLNARPPYQKVIAVLGPLSFGIFLLAVSSLEPTERYVLPERTRLRVKARSDAQIQAELKRGQAVTVFWTRGEYVLVMVPPEGPSGFVKQSHLTASPPPKPIAP